MGTANIKIRLSNASRPELSSVEVEAVADSEQPYLLLPERLAARLKLPVAGSRHIHGEEGAYETYAYAGPLLLQLGQEICYTGAVLDGVQVRVGSMALTAMNLVIAPGGSTVMPDPAGPPRLSAHAYTSAAV